MRIRKKKWARPELAACPFYVHEPKTAAGTWGERFKKQQPIHLDLGCGKCTFLAKLAHREKDVNFIGIDISEDILGVARRNIEAEFGEEPVENVNLLSYNIEKLDTLFSPDEKAARIYVNFCNPWQKAGDHKRRLTHTRQPGRSAKLNIDYVNDKRYLGVNNLILHHEIFNFDFLFNDLSHSILPMDFDTFYKSPQHFTAVATNLRTGEADYFEKSSCSDILAAIRASSSMPMLSKAVKMNGELYLDGGCAMAIPYQKAIDDGFEKIVLVLTRQQGYRKLYTKPSMLHLYAKYFRHFPKFLSALYAVPTRYDAQQREIDRLEKEGRIFVIRPQGPVNVSHTEKDTAKLKALYEEGRQEAARRMDALKRYLEA